MMRARPISRERSPLRMYRRRRRWAGVSWWYSAIFVVALTMLGGQLLFGGSSKSSDLSIKVFDASTGKTLPGAIVQDGQASATSDGKGVAKLAMPAANTLITIQLGGYASVYGTYSDGASKSQSVSLRPLSAPPPAPASDSGNGSQASQAQPTATAAASQLTAEPTVAATTVAPPQATQLTDTMAYTGAVSGVVTDANGKSLGGATVVSDKTVIQTAADGKFSLNSAPASGKIRVSASGYKDVTVNTGQNLSIKLDRLQIEAVYLNGTLAGDSDTVNRFIALIDKTELNAVVIDIKEGSVYYDTKVKFFSDAGALDVTYDPAALVKKFHDHGIYVIARQVIFNDPLIAKAYPNLAVKNTSGGLWKGADGNPWVNPFQQGLWQPNVDLSLEAIGYGFDEVQYDYVRFPSDGDLSTSDFGPNWSEDARVGAIHDFLKTAHDQIQPTGGKLSADVFGIVAVYPDDQGIGQRLVDLAPVVDYLCPMVYPSHFDPTSIDVGGAPNDHPYETVSLALTTLAGRIPTMTMKIRPWLQDFTLSGMSAYGPQQVDDQIKAAEETGSGWMLWNDGGSYTDSALKSDSGPNT